MYDNVYHFSENTRWGEIFNLTREDTQIYIKFC